MQKSLLAQKKTINKKSTILIQLFEANRLSSELAIFISTKAKNYGVVLCTCWACLKNLARNGVIRSIINMTTQLFQEKFN